MAQITITNGADCLSDSIPANTPLTGQRRNRVFVYEDYLGILSEGG